MQLRIDTRSIRSHYDVICNQIGNRYSGSRGEKRAAEYIADRFKAYRLVTQMHKFEFLNWRPRRIRATLIKDGKEERLTHAGPCNYSLSTPSGGIEGELVYLESSHPSILKSKMLKGKIGLSIGSFDVSNPEVARRFMQSGLKALMIVDDRIPFAWKVPVGMAPQWCKDFQMPMVAYPYLKAIALEKRLPARVRLELDCWTGKDDSQNVIGEIKGNKYPDEVIIVSAHLDTVPANVGADDNASGCIFTLELARKLAKLQPQRTLRFICYGAEERLSLGAYMYMRSLSKSEKHKIKFCLNADAIASRIGRNLVMTTGTNEMYKYFTGQFNKYLYPVEIKNRVTPYSDQFPLNIMGVPSLWISRVSMLGDNYWTLHSKHDNLCNVSPEILAQTASVCAGILADLARKRKMPFARKISPTQSRQVRKMAQDIYRHPWNPEFYSRENEYGPPKLS